jgi:hypothetical protein
MVNLPHHVCVSLMKFTYEFCKRKHVPLSPEKLIIETLALKIPPSATKMYSCLVKELTVFDWKIFE